VTRTVAVVKRAQGTPAAKTAGVTETQQLRWQDESCAGAAYQADPKGKHGARAFEQVEQH